MNDIQTSLKRILRELLKDFEVQEDIKKIVKKEREQEREFQRKLEALEKEKELLYRQLEEAHSEWEKLHENYKTLEKEKAILEKENSALEKENVVLEKEKKEIQHAKEELYQQLQEQKKEFEPFEEMNELWQGISKLEKSQKSYLKSLCGSWDIKSFIALGKDKNGIKQLWNFIKDEIMNSNRKTENIRILANFFDLCINVYNNTNIRKERYEIIEVFIGKEFDSRQYIKTSESIVNGVVQEVLLNGYCIQDDVIKPIVIVR